MLSKDWWVTKTPRDRLIIGASLAVLAAAFVAALIWAAMPRYRVLLSNLNAVDAANVANQLALEKIRYRLDEKKGQIMVAQGDLDLARLYVMERGLPQSRPVGFELFDEADFGMTDFNQRINYQRALEGELTRTIMALNEVDHARLHLVIPEVSLFKRQDEKPKASLTLSLKPGSSLTAQHVQGIQNLIAAAVPGLVPEHVAIHDQFGAALSLDPADPLAGGLVAARLEAKRAYEAYLSRKAQDILDRAFGPGAGAVMVDVEVDHDRKQLTRTEVLPVREGVTGAVTGLRSQRGNRSPMTPGEVIDDEPDRELVPQNATTEVRYEVGKQEEHVQVTAGAIRRMTVGVLVPRGLAEEQRQRIADTIASAIGLDPVRRGDSISVQELAAIPAAAAVKPTKASKASFALGNFESSEAMIWAIGAALAVLVAAFAAFSLGRGGSQPRLSLPERERMLTDLRRWLDDETATSRSGRT